MITQKVRFTALFLLFLIISSLYAQVITINVDAEEINQSANSEESKIGLFGKLIKSFGNFMTTFKPIFRLSVASASANPPYIEIGYNETVNIEVGMWDVVNNEGFEEWAVPKPIFTERFLNFQVVEYPGGNDQGSWFVTFDPYTIYVKLGTLIKSNMSITLTRPPSSKEPIQSGILKVRILDTWAFGNVYLPPKGSPSDKFPDRFFWFFSAAFLMKFGKLSGTTEVEYKDIDILVKIKPYHAVRFAASPLMYLHPDQLTSIPITIQNLGNYNDTYGFRVISDNENIKFASPYYITLAPGETSQTYLGVSTPISTFDYGTVNEIIIETYSIEEPEITIAQRQVFIETKGLYFNEMGGMILFLLIAVIIIAIAFYIHRRKMFIEKYCVKPDKPWEIPEEKQYLDTLIKTDKKRYNEVLKMMENEYESSLLWYKYYCKRATKPKQIKEEKIKEEKVKIKEEKPEEIKEEKSVIKEKPKEELIKKIEIEKQETKKIEKKVKDEESKKQQAMSRIKKEQDKQKNKFKT